VSARQGTDDRARVRRKGACVHPFEPDEPSGYIGWHDWAKRKAETHDQRQCPDCGLWAIWTPKEAA
jgi:hypothetical protein